MRSLSGEYLHRIPALRRSVPEAEFQIAYNFRDCKSIPEWFGKRSSGWSWPTIESSESDSIRPRNPHPACGDRFLP